MCVRLLRHIVLATAVFYALLLLRVNSRQLPAWRCSSILIRSVRIVLWYGCLEGWPDSRVASGSSRWRSQPALILRGTVRAIRVLVHSRGTFSAMYECRCSAEPSPACITASGDTELSKLVAPDMPGNVAWRMLPPARNPASVVVEYYTTLHTHYSLRKRYCLWHP
jgi:hypothetical protein